jgi:hypothetical protein
MNLMSRLAIFGGTPQRTKPFSSWPAFGENQEQALLEVLRSGKRWRYSYAHNNHPTDYASFEALCPNAERACREAVWLEHRQLLAEREDMGDIVQAIERIHEHRLDFKPGGANEGG